MPLSAGARLGPYEILSALGAGGMGEVYRARDTRLKREVALKILPESFAADPERLARFQREAEVLASLNHPHIAAIYGVEDADGVRALVLELVEGETLADRIARGPIPVDEALPIARQICEALEAAHEHGIIHRDLKPANIKITPDGVVKVLDFGLAKLADPAHAPASDLSLSPTITSPAMMTGVGVLLGTAAYMSPEQAKGREADKRSDIWAFGCVLYEMLTGKRPFDGEDVSDTLANVLKIDPDWSALPSDIPPAIQTLLQSCLTKDRRRRMADISTPLFVLEKGASLAPPAGTVSAAPLPRRPLWRRIMIPVAAGVVVGGLIAGIAVWSVMQSALPAPRVARFELPLPASETLAVAANDYDLAISPDGTRVVYKVIVGAQSLLTVRAIDELTARPLQGLPQAIYSPFISPDGAWVGFSDEADGSLKRVSILGGPAVRICVTGAGTAGIDGASWGDDDTIVFGTATPSGLWRVAAGGGMPKELTKLAPGQTNHAWPEMLPGSRAVLFTILNGASAENAQVAVLNLVTGEQKVLVPGGSYPRYSPTGHIVYGLGGTLRAVPFDVKRLEVTGTPVPVLDQVITKDTVTPLQLGAADFAMARDGSLVYLSGSAIGSVQRTLAWVDRQGREAPIPAPPRAYTYPRLSPDGTRVAVYANDQEQDIWVWNLSRITLTRGTFAPAYDGYPVWTPDGRRLIFSSDRAGARNLFWQAADGTGAVEQLTESSNPQTATAVSPDGRRLIFGESGQRTAEDVMQVELDGTHRVTPLVQSPFGERNGIVSPDGRWLAYESYDSGRAEIYVRPYPDVNSGHWQVSTAGGSRPLWARSGQELFYISPAGAIMGVGVERGASWSATTPTTLVKEGYYTIPAGGNNGRSYDISSDGQRFLMIKNADGADRTAAAPKIIVVQHWAEELKRLVPTK